MEIAKAQVGTVFQTGLMLYMFVGNQLALFNMMFLVTFGLNPINSLLATERSECSPPLQPPPLWVGYAPFVPSCAAFAPVSVPGASVFAAKALYVALNLIGLGIVVWKVKAMGLLPLTSADWVSLLPVKHIPDFASVPETL